MANMLTRTWDRLTRAEAKASATGPLMMRVVQQAANWMKRDSLTFAKEGYTQNVITYRCVRLLSRSAARVPWCLEDIKTGEKINEHPMLDLLRRPNPVDRSASAFFERAFGFYLIAGENFMEGVGPVTGPPMELYANEPWQMEVKPGDTVPSQFIFRAGGGKVVWDVDALDGASDILHTKMFNPLDRWRGMSPIQAAAFSIDQHNAAGEWNASLLQNGAQPTLALIYKGTGDNPILTTDQRKVVREEIDKFWAGPGNAGKVQLVPGNFDMKAVSATNKEMDWLLGKQLSAKEIALAYDVPEQLVGVEGSQKFDNYAQARLALWEDGVLPLMATFGEDLGFWLGPAFDLDMTKMRLTHSLDDVEALSPRRQAKWDRAASSSGFTSINDRRQMVGLEPKGELDDETNPHNQILISATMVPASIDFDDDEPEPDDEEGKRLSVVAFGR